MNFIYSFQFERVPKIQYNIGGHHDLSGMNNIFSVLMALRTLFVVTVFVVTQTSYFIINVDMTTCEMPFIRNCF